MDYKVGQKVYWYDPVRIGDPEIWIVKAVSNRMGTVLIVNEAGDFEVETYTDELEPA